MTSMDDVASPPSGLDQLREQARSGEITVDTFVEACLRRVVREMGIRFRSYSFLRHEDPEDLGAEVFATASRLKAGANWLFDTVERLQPYFETCVKHWLIKENIRRGKRPVEAWGGQINEGSDGGPAPREVADPALDVDVYEAAAAIGRAAARRRTVALRAEANAGGRCPFHPNSPCPHADRVIEFLEYVIESGRFLTEEDVAALLTAKGRKLSLPPSRTRRGSSKAADGRTLSDRDHTLDRHFRCCFHWWRYRAFVETDLDPAKHRGSHLKHNEPSSPTDPLRMPIVDFLRLTGAGKWDSSACPVDGALNLVLGDEEFWRLLDAHKPAVYEELEGRTR